MAQFKVDNSLVKNLMDSMNLEDSSREQLNTLEKNILKLGSRKKGEKLYVDRTGLLRTVKGLTKVKFLIKDCFTDSHEVLLREEVTKIVMLLGSKDLFAHSQDIMNFLSRTRLRKMSPKLYERNKIKPEVFNALSPNINYWETRKIRLEKEVLPVTPAENRFEIEKAISDYRFYIKQEQIKLTQKLGMDLVLNGTGFTGSYKGKSLFGTLASIKPVDEDQDAKNAPMKAKLKTFFCDLFGMQRRTCLTPGEGVHAEVGAALFNQHMRMSVVPDTRLIEFESPEFAGTEKFKKVSFQEWLSNGVMANKFNDWNKLSQDETEDFVLHDVGIGGLDTHGENWMIIGSGTLDEPYRIKAFDNGLSMSHDHPSDKFALRNMYRWAMQEELAPNLAEKDYPFNKPFSEHALKRMEHLKRALPQMCEELHKHYSDQILRDPRTAHRKIARMLERLEALAYYVREANNPNNPDRSEYTPANFARDMRTPENYITFFHKYKHDKSLNSIREAAGKMPGSNVNWARDIKRDHPTVAKKLAKKGLA